MPPLRSLTQRNMKQKLPPYVKGFSCRKTVVFWFTFSWFYTCMLRCSVQRRRWYSMLLNNLQMFCYQYIVIISSVSKWVVYLSDNYLRFFVNYSHYCLPSLDLCVLDYYECGVWYPFCPITWRCKHFPRCWPFVRGIHRSPVNSPHKGQWRGALMFSMDPAWTNDRVNNLRLVSWDAIALIMTPLLGSELILAFQIII